MKKLSIVLLSLALAGCGFLRDPGSPLAKVKNRTLTLEELRSQGDSMNRQVAMRGVEEWVNQEVLYQEALSMNLQKDREVAWLLHDAERKILVDAWKRRFDQAIPDPEEGELEIFYDKRKDQYLREEAEYSLSMVAFPNLKAAQEASKALPTTDWKTICHRADSTAADSVIDRQTWVKAGKLDPCLSGIVATLKPGSVSLPQICNAQVLLVKLNGRKAVGEALTFDEARPRVLSDARAAKRAQRLDSLLGEAKSRQAVFTWPENLPKP